MKNSKAYFDWHYILLTLFLMLCVFSVIEASAEYLIMIIPMMVPVGLVQLLTALGYTFQKLPEPFKSDWRTYWMLTALFFIVLTVLYHGEFTRKLYWSWLYGMPWLIVAYQVNLVSRIYKWKLTKKVDLTNQINSKS